MCKMVYACSKCGKIYKNNGKWLMKHQIEVCHVKFLKPNELVVKNSVDLSDIIKRLEYLENMVSNGKIMPKYSDDPIERIKQEEEQKISDPVLRKYRQAFKECISELKEVLKIRKIQVEQTQPIEIEQLELVMA